MSHNLGDLVQIKRSNDTTSLARIIDKPIYWVSTKMDKVQLIRPSSTVPVVGDTVRVKDKEQNPIECVVTQMYKVQILKDDLTHTGQDKTIPESDIVASMVPHFRGLNFLKLKNDLPHDIRMQMDENEIDEMIENAANAPMNVKKLKLFMNKYQAYPAFIKKIREKLNSIILTHYGKYGKFKFHDGAHPEFIMNAFLYDPPKSENRFKVLRIDGNQVTYQPSYDMLNKPSRDKGPMTIGLDEFLKMRISAQNDYGLWTYIPIGEVYRFFPERNSDYDTDDDYNDKVNNYLEHLMKLFANKPHTEFFSVPIAAVASTAASSASSSSTPIDSEWWKFRSAELRRRSAELKRRKSVKEIMSEILLNPPKLRKVSSVSHHDGGSRKKPKSTHKRRVYKKSKKSRNSRKSKKH